MSVLAIDTSSRQRTVVVIATPDGTLRRSDVRSGVPVGAAVPESIAALLEPEVTAVVVVAGPGSYTGLRAGMAAALGIAHARDLPLGRPRPAFRALLEGWGTLVVYHVRFVIAQDLITSGFHPD